MANAKTWAKRVAAWRSSGETAERYAARVGVRANTLKWWGWRLGGKQSLVRVVASAPMAWPARGCPIEVEAGGVRVVVRPGFDRATLMEVMDIVGAPRAT